MKHKISVIACSFLLLLLLSLGYSYKIVQAQLVGDSCEVYKNTESLEEQFGSFFIDAASFVGWEYNGRICDKAEIGVSVDVSFSLLMEDFTVTNQNSIGGKDFFIPYRTELEFQKFVKAVVTAVPSSPLNNINLCITSLENTENRDFALHDGTSTVILGCDNPINACGELISFTDPRDGTSYSLQATGAACWMTEDYNYWWVLLQDLWDLDTDNDNTIFYDIDGGSYVDGAIIPAQLYNICQAFLPEGESDGAALASFYYEGGSSEVMACEYTNGESYDIDNIPELQDGNDYNGITIGNNLYDYHSNDDDFLSTLCPTGWDLPTEAELLAASNDLMLTNGGVFLNPANKISYSTTASNYFAWGASYNGYNNNYAVFEGSPTGQVIAGYTRCVKD